MRLALIGDIHGHWEEHEDAAALAWLGADLAIFLGDVGEEDVHLVRQIAALPTPKAVILGAAAASCTRSLCCYLRCSASASLKLCAWQGTTTPGVPSLLCAVPAPGLRTPARRPLRCLQRPTMRIGLPPASSSVLLM